MRALARRRPSETPAADKPAASGPTPLDDYLASVDARAEERVRELRQEEPQAVHPPRIKKNLAASQSPKAPALRMPSTKAGVFNRASSTLNQWMAARQNSMASWISRSFRRGPSRMSSMNPGGGGDLKAANEEDEEMGLTGERERRRFFC